MNGFMSTNEGKRVMVMLVLLVVGTGVFFYLEFMGGGEGTDAAGRDRRAYHLQEAGPAPPGRDVTAQVPVKKVSGKVSAEVAQGKVEFPVDVPQGVTVADREEVVEQEYLFRVLHAVNIASQEELRARAVDFDFKDLFFNPDKFRGNVVRFHGRIRNLVRRYDKELPDDLPFLNELQITDSDWRWYYVILIDRHPPFVVGDLVEVTGVFVKIYAYRSRRDTMVYSPLFVCKKLEPYTVPDWPLWRPIGWVMGVIVAVCAVVFFLLWRSQQRESLLLKEKVARLQQKRFVRSKVPESVSGEGGEKKEDGEAASREEGVDDEPGDSGT